MRPSQGGSDIDDKTYLTEIGFFQSSSNNKYYLVVNSFRDIVFWGKGGQYSQLLIKPLDTNIAGGPDDKPLENGLSTSNSIELLYGLSAFNDLRLLSSDFHGESVSYINISPKEGNSDIYKLNVEGYLK